MDAQGDFHVYWEYMSEDESRSICDCSGYAQFFLASMLKGKLFWDVADSCHAIHRSITDFDSDVSIICCYFYQCYNICYFLWMSFYDDDNDGDDAEDNDHVCFLSKGSFKLFDNCS